MIRAAWLAALLAVACHAAASTTADPAEYGRILGGSARQLEQAARASHPDRKLARAALGRVPKQVVVQGVQVDNASLLEVASKDLDGGREGVIQAGRLLRSVQHAVEVRPVAVAPDARRMLAEVLSRQEFRPGWFSSWSERVQRWIARVLEAIFRHIPDIPVPALGSTRPVLVVVLLILIGGAIALLVVRLVWQLMQRGRLEEVSEQAVVKPHSTWLEEAESAQQAGDYRAAVRALHMAALMKLDEAGHLSYADWRTDGRFVHALKQGGRPDLAGALAGLSQLFALIWYGMAPAGPAEYAAAAHRWRELEGLAAA